MSTKMHAVWEPMAASLDAGKGMAALLAAFTPPGKTAPPREQLEAMSARILVIEDDAADAEAMVDLLRAAGHDVKLATTGEMGLALAREWKPGLVVCEREKTLMVRPAEPPRDALADAADADGGA